MTEPTPIFPGLKGPKPPSAVAVVAMGAPQPAHIGTDFLDTWSAAITAEQVAIDAKTHPQTDIAPDDETLLGSAIPPDAEDIALPMALGAQSDEDMVVQPAKIPLADRNAPDLSSTPDRSLRHHTERSDSQLLKPGRAPDVIAQPAETGRVTAQTTAGLVHGNSVEKLSNASLHLGTEKKATQPKAAAPDAAELRFLAEAAAPKTVQTTTATKADNPKPMAALGLPTSQHQAAMAVAAPGPQRTIQPAQVSAPSPETAPQPSALSALMPQSTSNAALKAVDQSSLGERRSASAARQDTGGAQSFTAAPLGAAVPVATSPTLHPPTGTANPQHINLLRDAPFDPFAPEGEGSISVANSNTAAATRASAIHPMQPHAPHAAQQIAVATVQSQAGKTEITLNPEELGRVRMALTSGDGGISVSIVAERPETADLLRRNIELLMREFRDMGYASVDFSFGDQDDGSAADAQGAPTDQQTHTPATPGQDPEPHITTVALSGGLDLKL